MYDEFISNSNLCIDELFFKWRLGIIHPICDNWNFDDFYADFDFGFCYDKERQSSGFRIHG